DSRLSSGVDQSGYTQQTRRIFGPRSLSRSVMKKLITTILLLGMVAGLLHAQVPPEKAETTFTVHNPELEWKLWASEPLFANPTSMDIDHLGRVWVCESVNYRHTLHHRPPNRPAGDRILILDASKGTGKADKMTAFYQP